MSEWKKIRLGDLVSIKGGFSYKGKFIGKGSSILLGMGCVSFNEKFLYSGGRLYSGEFPESHLAKPGDLVIATRQQSDNMPILGFPAIIPDDYEGIKVIVGTNLYKVTNDSEINNHFLYWLFKSPNYRNHILASSKGTTVRMITKDAVESFEFYCPEKKEREAISGILWQIERKIDLLHRQNKTLEEMAQTLFRQWFIEEVGDKWKEVPLTEIANFLNGLACQKFPPQNDLDKLPVLKIKDLKDGISDNSDWATSDIKPEYIIESGDVIFAWSASLMVKIWDGEKCVLNQHLFKVTSEKYPKWFYYQWCLFHLDNFIAIAHAHATTMGHIKRKDLDNAMCSIPTDTELEVMNEQMVPLMEKMENNSKQIKSLEKMRNTLLPQLMSGEVRVEL